MKIDVKLIERYKYFIIAILIGVVLMIITPTTTQESMEVTIENGFDLEQTTQELEDILSKIDGVGRVDVMLTVSESNENIYAIDQTTSENSDKSEVVIVSKNGDDTPITIKNVYPKFNGALVVCDGALDNSIKLMIIEAIKSLYDISSNKITITKMTN